MKYSPDQFVDWSGSQGDVLQQVRDQGGNRRTLGSVESHVTEQRVPFELLNYSHHPVVAAHAKVVALCHVVGQYHPGVLADAAEHGEQHVALQTLRLIDDDEGVVQRPAANVGQREHLKQATLQYLLDHYLGGHRPQRVEDSLGPGRHLFALGAGQIAEFLSTDGVERAEHHHLGVLVPLDHRLQTGAQRECRLTCPCTSAEGDDPDGRVQQQIQCHSLLGGPAVNAECVTVGLDQSDVLGRCHPSQR